MHTRLPAFLLASSMFRMIIAVPTAVHHRSVSSAEDYSSISARPADRLKPEWKPNKKDDHLTTGNVEKALHDSKSELDPIGWEQLPDYDSSQRSRRPDGPYDGQHKTYDKLCEVGVEVAIGSEGKSMRTAFEESTSREFIILETVDSDQLDRSKKVKLTKAGDEIVDKLEDEARPWQADRVCGIGLFAHIVNGTSPKGIDKKTWQLIQGAVQGTMSMSEDRDLGLLSNPSTMVIGHILNDPANIRGITNVQNQLKNFVAAWAYGTENHFEPWHRYERSTVWHLYKYQAVADDQFNETFDKVLLAIDSIINDKAKAKPILDHFRKEALRFKTRMKTELERVLEKPPPGDKDTYKSLFKDDDCSNTRYTPPDGGDESATKPSTPGPPPREAPYAPGVCRLNLIQTTTDNTKSNAEYMLEPQVFDSKGKSIGYTQPESAGSTHVLKLQTFLEDLFEMTPTGNHNGMVNFVLGLQKWDTTINYPTKPAYCNKRKDSRDGKQTKKEYDCYFVCQWAGGKSSNGAN